MNLKSLILEKGLTQVELAKRLGIDKYQFNGFVKYKYLPVPDMLEALCKELQCEPLNIYEESELYINPENKPVVKQKAKFDTDVYHLSVRLPKSRCNSLQQPANLHRLGYLNLTDFIWKSFLKFEEELHLIKGIVERKEENKINE